MTKITLAHIPTKGGEFRDQLLARLVAIADETKAKEPNTLAYVVGVAHDPSDTKTVYMIEIYADQASLDAHMDTELVKEMLGWMVSSSALEGAPNLRVVDVPDEIDLFVRSETIGTVADPLVVVADLIYPAGQRETSWPDWTKVVAGLPTNEPGTLMYSILRDPGDADRLLALEVYENESALKDVHAKNAVLLQTLKSTQSFSLQKLKKYHGFFSRA